MLLFGRHPFLSEADMALSQADQMVCLIENTVKGSIQLPDSARQTDPACDLLSRILVPSPKQRYGVNDIFEHAWFTAKLPPGALELNNAYLPAMGYQVRAEMEATQASFRDGLELNNAYLPAMGC